MTDLPTEPPVGTLLTAHGHHRYFTRDQDGWWVCTRDRTRLVPGGPGASWEEVHDVLTQFGGVQTVTVEYEAAYVIDREVDNGRTGGMRSRAHIARWAETMTATFGPFRVTAIRSRTVTHSTWTDEPLEDPT